MGSSLIELMVSAAISSIVVTGLTITWNTQLYNQYQSQTKMDLGMVTNEIHAALSKEALCNQMLAGQDYRNAISITPPGSTAPLIAENLTIAQVTITKVRIENVTESNPANPAENIKYGSLNIEGLIPGNAPSQVGKSLYVSFLDNNGIITRCSSGAPLATQGSNTLPQKICADVAAQPASYNALVAVAGVPLVGTGGNDIILGTPGDDTLSGAGGDDIICGNGGNDNLYGDTGNDVCVDGVVKDQCEE